MKQQKDSRGGRHCTEVRFASFLSGGFITAIVVNPPERKLAKLVLQGFLSHCFLVLHKCGKYSKGIKVWHLNS